MHLVVRAALLGLAGCAGPSPAARSPDPPSSAPPLSDSLVHAGSGQQFPAEIGLFRRAETASFAPDRSDLAVAYDLPQPGETVTILVYVHAEPRLPTLGEPPGRAEAIRAQGCAAAENARVADIAAHYNATVATDRPITLAADRARDGRLVALDYATLEAGRRRPRRVELAVFCRAGGDWTMEFRFAYPLDAAPGDAITRFMREMPWTGRFSPPNA